MNNFKSGSGDLDFGGGDEDDGNVGEGDEDDRNGGSDETGSDAGPERGETGSPVEEHPPVRRDDASPDTEGRTDDQRSDRESGGSPAASRSSNEYPYFVRRNNVGDERDTRLEIHVRDRVAEREATFRTEVAKQLGTSEVSKTDAREFALLAAFENPERVAELMETEGFGALD